MKKTLTAFAFALLPALVLGSGNTNPVTELALPRVDSAPVVSVYALSAEQARELARVRSEYLAKKTELEAEYEARMDAILAKPVADSI